MHGKYSVYKNKTIVSKSTTKKHTCGLAVHKKGNNVLSIPLKKSTVSKIMIPLSDNEHESRLFKK